jgi:hypothetical protein
MGHDVICDLDRHLIEAHLARKGVTIVARGVSGLDPHAPLPGFFANVAAGRARRVAKRRAEVRRLIVDKGATQEAMAKALDVCVSTICHDVKALRDEGRLPPDYPRGAKHG